LRGLQQRIAELDAITAYQAGLSATPDPELLAWAAENERILLTHDRKTMPSHVAARIETGKKLAGVIIVPRRLPISQAIDELEIIIVCSLEDEWNDLVQFLPL
jgi:predicted nuclease of predicted toxin-antitoxin system